MFDERKGKQSSRFGRTYVLQQNKILVLMMMPGDGWDPYKNERGACRKFSKNTLKGTRNTFHGRGSN